MSDHLPDRVDELLTIATRKAIMTAGQLVVIARMHQEPDYDRRLVLLNLATIQDDLGVIKSLVEQAEREMRK